MPTNDPILSGLPAKPLPDTSVLQSEITIATRWFFWIAGLSFANGLITAFGGTWNFLFGLGVTEFVDGVTNGILKGPGAGSPMTWRFVSLAVDAIIAGLFVMCGTLSRERKVGIYIGGMVFYALDTILVLVFQDWLKAAFHAWVLWRLWSGLRAFNERDVIEAQATGNRPVT